MNPKQKLRWSRRLSFVPRWVVVPTIRRQNVAEHSYHVVFLTREICKYHRQEKDTEFVLEAVSRAIDHDIEEAAKGDPPSTTKAKRDWSVFKHDQSLLVYKAADVMEAIIYLMEEKKLGNDWNLDLIIDERVQELSRIMENINFHDGVDPQSVWMIIQDTIFSSLRPHPNLEIM